MSQQDTKSTLVKSKASAAKLNSIESADGGQAKEVKFVSAGVFDAVGGSAAGIEVRFSSGVSINVCKDFDTETFKEVVAILGAQFC